MPTYEYRCDACGHEFELYQQITAPVKRKCPECGKPRLTRLIGTGAGVIFKGSGFYETDYRSENYKKAAEADKKAAEPATETKKDSKTDSTSTSSETPSAVPAEKPAPKRSKKPLAKTRSTRKR